MGIFDDGNAKVGSCKAQWEIACCGSNAKANTTPTCGEGGVEVYCSQTHCIKY